MKNLDLFIKYICGEFNNKEQIDKEKKSGKIIHPEAVHINNVCNDRILNLPKDFHGYFVLEESYYTKESFKNSLPHLFLFRENEEGKVVLTSYEIPKNIKKEEFRYDNNNLIMDYNDLEVSKKFNPLIYNYNDNTFLGESLSYFSPTLKFYLKESLTENKILVSENFYKDNIRIFGFDEPIIYIRKW